MDAVLGIAAVKGTVRILAAVDGKGTFFRLASTNCPAKVEPREPVKLENGPLYMGASDQIVQLFKTPDLWHIHDNLGQDPKQFIPVLVPPDFQVMGPARSKRSQDRKRVGVWALDGTRCNLMRVPCVGKPETVMGFSSPVSAWTIGLNHGHLALTTTSGDILALDADGAILMRLLRDEASSIPGKAT